jgi:hypothetical protein
VVELVAAGMPEDFEKRAPCLANLHQALVGGFLLGAFRCGGEHYLPSQASIMNASR